MDSIINSVISEEPKEEVKKFASEDDEKLMQMLNEHKARIKVVGVGGGGNNTINRISEIGIEGCMTIAINTDVQDLLQANAKRKILIGKEATKGLGAGAKPSVGEAAAKESESEIKEALRNSDLVFITCGMGGGTGTGAAPVVAEIAKKMGILVIGVVTAPFSMEGSKRSENANLGLSKIEKFVDTLIVIPNEKLLDIAPNLPLHIAFKLADEVLTNAVKGITELVTKTGLMNLDFADIKTIMKDGGVAMIGLGESDSDNRAEESVERALHNPLLDVDLKGAKGALVNVTGGSNMTLEEAKKIVSKISQVLDPEANLIWGANISEDFGKMIRTMVVITGVSSNQIGGKIAYEKREKMIDDELGIDFID